ncbi:MAG: PH domain-containing protein [Pseudomonadota bacterium]|jgi:membrane protein YdbS with pleckstrin-like domain
MNPTDLLPAPAVAAMDPDPASARAGEAATAFQLHPRALVLWRWTAWAWIGVLATPAAAGFAFNGKPLPALLLALAALLLALWLRRYLGAYAARFRCRLLLDGLWIERGVYWRRETFVPRARVQHTDVNQGPLARRFGIAGLKVFTAGTHAAGIEVDGLAHADALALRDRLLGRGGADGV